MTKILDVMGDKAMKTAGDKARRGINNFMKAFEKDYEIEHIVADLKLELPKIKGNLKIKMKKKP